MQEGWHKIAKYPKSLAMVLFIVIFSIGFFLTQKIEEETGEKSIQLENTQQAAIELNNSLDGAYINDKNGFAILYPKTFTIDENYKYQAFGPGKDINGVKFTIPAKITTGTNLSSDSYLSIETIPGVKTCTANLFLDGAKKAQIFTDDGTTYSVAFSDGAAAGNRYEEKVFALPDATTCTALRYFIHYSVLENYPPNTIKEFNRVALLSQFDAMRQTFIPAE